MVQGRSKMVNPSQRSLIYLLIETNYISDELSHQNADNKDFLSRGDVLHCPGLNLQPFSSSDLHPSSYLILGVMLFLKNKDEKLVKVLFLLLIH